MSIFERYNNLYKKLEEKGLNTLAIELYYKYYAVSDAEKISVITEFEGWLEKNILGFQGDRE